MKADPEIRIWPIPIALGILTATGLVAGLLSDGVGDVLAWLGLGLPLAVAIGFAFGSRRGQARRRR